jgi:putative addiction module component (TIGR02574 family)
MSFDELLSAASYLPPQDRLRLSDLLRETIPAGQMAELSEEWIAEIHRRSEAYDAGEMSASPWETVRSRTRKQAGLDG